MPKRSLGLRFVAAGLSIVFIHTNILFAHLPQTSVWEERQQRFAQPITKSLAPSPLPALSGKRRSPLLAGLPASLFSHLNIKDIHSNAAGRTVLLIEDLHQNLEAQSHISEAIRSFGGVAGEGVTPVYLEGAAGGFLFNDFRKFPDANVRTVADSFFNKNDISGPAHAGFAFRPQPGNKDLFFWGVEDRALYRRNVAAYRNTRAIQSATQSRIDGMKRDLADQKNRGMNAALKAFDAMVESHRADSLPLGDYAQALIAAGAPATLPVETFLQAWKMEKSLDLARVEQQRAIVLEKLVKKLSKSDLDALMSVSLGYQQGAANFSDYYAYLRALCKKAGVELAETPQFDEYIRYVLLTDGVDASRLFTDLERMEQDAYDRLAGTSEEKRLVAYSSQLYLAGKLVTFAMTSEEWARYQKGRAVLSGMDLTPFEEFYVAADLRNEAMVARMGSSDDFSVLVAGGYHTQGLTLLLNKKGVSCIVATPKVTKLEATQTNYLSVFDREKTPLAQLFTGKKLFLVAPVAAQAINASPDKNDHLLPGMEDPMAKMESEIKGNGTVFYSGAVGLALVSTIYAVAAKFIPTVFFLPVLVIVDIPTFAPGIFAAAILALIAVGMARAAREDNFSKRMEKKLRKEGFRKSSYRDVVKQFYRDGYSVALAEDGSWTITYSGQNDFLDVPSGFSFDMYWRKDIGELFYRQIIKPLEDGSPRMKISRTYLARTLTDSNPLVDFDLVKLPNDSERLQIILSYRALDGLRQTHEFSEVEKGVSYKHKTGFGVEGKQAKGAIEILCENPSVSVSRRKGMIGVALVATLVALLVSVTVAADWTTVLIWFLVGGMVASSFGGGVHAKREAQLVKLGFQPEESFDAVLYKRGELVVHLFRDGSWGVYERIKIGPLLLTFSVAWNKKTGRLDYETTSIRIATKETLVNIKHWADVEHDPWVKFEGYVNLNVYLQAPAIELLRRSGPVESVTLQPITKSGVRAPAERPKGPRSRKGSALVATVVLVAIAAAAFALATVIAAGFASGGDMAFSILAVGAASGMTFGKFLEAGIRYWKRRFSDRAEELAKWRNSLPARKLMDGPLTKVVTQFMNDEGPLIEFYARSVPDSFMGLLTQLRAHPRGQDLWKIKAETVLKKMLQSLTKEVSDGQWQRFLDKHAIGLPEPVIKKPAKQRFSGTLSRTSTSWKIGVPRRYLGNGFVVVELVAAVGLIAAVVMAVAIALAARRDSIWVLVLSAGTVGAGMMSYVQRYLQSQSESDILGERVVAASKMDDAALADWLKRQAPRVEYVISPTEKLPEKGTVERLLALAVFFSQGDVGPAAGPLIAAAANHARRNDVHIVEISADDIDGGTQRLDAALPANGKADVIVVLRGTVEKTLLDRFAGRKIKAVLPLNDGLKDADGRFVVDAILTKALELDDEEAVVSQVGYVQMITPDYHLFTASAELQERLRFLTLLRGLWVLVDSLDIGRILKAADYAEKFA